MRVANKVVQSWVDISATVHRDAERKLVEEFNGAFGGCHCRLLVLCIGISACLSSCCGRH